MNFKLLTKEDWNRSIADNSGSFLQSWEWGEFQEKFGRKVWRLTGDNYRAQFIEMPLPFGKKYWHCPRGPIMANSQWPIANSKLNEIVNEIKNSISKTTVIFFRFGPEWDLSSGQSLVASGFRRLPYDIEPSQTLILDITKNEDELLAQMHEKWRYNIRLAERKGVKIKIVSASDAEFEKYFEEFYRLTDQGTAMRKEIKHHPKEYYRQQLTINKQQLKFLLFVAEYENQVIAASILVIFGRRATYLHGATAGEHREVMAPHLLQWEQIKYAKAQGCSEYDFWGIVNEHTLDKRGPSWEGFTRFKKGFGGREVNYIGYWDYPLDKFWYSIYRVVQKFRR